ncbi:MAG TPA: cyanophycin synthetase [Candidatus Atribacteria bacterium]|nr:cyanophycin synthetase [Candidatus Atribacteria bacterium]
MLIKEIRIYKGRNIYSHQKVVRIIIDLGIWDNVTTNEINNFNQRLVDLLPGLRRHCCSLGYEGGFLEHLEKGTNLAHVIEHCAIEIQNKLGHDVSFGQTRQIKNSSFYNVVFAYKNEQAGIESGRLAVQIAEALCKQEQIDIDEGIDRIKELIYRYGLGPSTQAIVDAAIERGIPVTRIGRGNIIQLGYGKYLKKMEGTLSESTSCISADIASDKAITNELLAQAGIPVPRGVLCYSGEEAVQAAESIGYPVVVKPSNGNQGKGVSLGLQTKDEVIDAYDIASRINDCVLVEEYIKGNDYRVLIIGNQVTAVALRIPAYVIGDGIHSIKELVDIKNSDDKRGIGHEKPLTRIVIDDISINLLKKQGYTPDSIPGKGERVHLKSNGNLSTGGEAVDCTDKIHPYNQEIAIRAARIIGLDIAGVDITCSDISKPIKAGRGAVIEVNASPGIRMHLYPTKGKARKVGDAIVDMLFPSGSRHSIPIVSVTGTNGKTTTTRMIGHILRTYGLNVGMTTTSGIYINDQCILKGDTTGPASAQIILSDKAIEAAVLETARGGIIRAGLGYDLSDVGVLTNISDDHLGIDGIETLEEMLHVKSLVVESVKSNGFAVLNADDQMVVQAAKRVKANIIYFSRQDDNLIIHRHIAEGGYAVFLKDGFVTIATGNGLVKSMPITQVPATYNGKLLYNIENCLAAISAAYALKIPLHVIESALISFHNDEIHNPGRFNIYNIRDFRIVVDYGHNTAGYENVTDAVKKLGASRLVGIIGVPGDRSDSVIKRIGEISGRSFDRVFIKEDKDLRNRKKGEVAQLLLEGVINAGLPMPAVSIHENEEDALKEAIRTAAAGDVIVVFYEDLDCITRIIYEELEKSTSGSIKHKQKDLLLIKR